MPNKWLAHVKKTMKNMKAKGTYAKGKGLKQVIMAAKKTWHKAKKGGADDDGLKDVSLGDSGKADSPTEQMGTTVTDPKGEEASVLGGRRKTRRRRASRRR